MSAPTGLADNGATLLEADPELTRTIGVREAAGIGHQPVLPVLAVAIGVWVAPERSRLGPGTVALTVLDGLLMAGSDPRALLGPGDVLAPWDTAAVWTACTPVRLAVIGRAYGDALRAWPGATDVLCARVSTLELGPQPGGGSVEERLLDLLWRIGQRHGQLDRYGVALPPALDLRALGLILGAPEMALALALAALRDRGAVIRRAGPGWSLPAPTRGHVETQPHGRRDALRSHVALQLAVSRAARDECQALCEQLALELRRRSELRGAR
jgi:hypothetical protein